MKFGNKEKLAALMWVIMFVAYNILVFVIGGFSGHGISYWISYVFMIIAIFALAGAGIMLSKKGDIMRDWLFGYPIVRHTLIYFSVELVLSILFMIIEKICLFAIAFSAQFVVLAIYSVFAISCLMAKEKIQEIKTEIKEKTQYMRLMRVDAEMAAEKCTDPTTHATFSKLAEDIRYSDPMSNDALVDLERLISTTISEASAYSEIGDNDTAKALCQKASLLLAERNKKCKVLK